VTYHKKISWNFKEFGELELELCLKKVQPKYTVFERIHQDMRALEF
jgi:hypothetical protein